MVKFNKRQNLISVTLFNNQNQILWQPYKILEQGLSSLWS